MKNRLVTGVFVMLFFIVAGCGGGQRSTEPLSQQAEKRKVIATVYPVYDFAKRVAGDKLDIILLVQPGAEPHDWEPTAKDLRQIKTAAVFLYHGAGFEPWIDKLLNPEIVGSAQAVEVSKGIPLLEAHEEHEGHHADPHVWLDPVLAQQEVSTIEQAFSAADPNNSAYYRANAERFRSELNQLHEDYKLKLAGLPRREIVTSHTAFGYLTARYQLRQTGVMGLAPDADPTPERMVEVIKFCKTNQVKYIFFETLVNPRVAETIARETGASTLVLNPIEGLTPDEKANGKDYIVLMRDNLTNLQKALSE